MSNKSSQTVTKFKRKKTEKNVTISRRALCLHRRRQRRRESHNQSKYRLSDKWMCKDRIVYLSWMVFLSQSLIVTSLCQNTVTMIRSAAVSSSSKGIQLFLENCSVNHSTQRYTQTDAVHYFPAIFEIFWGNFTHCPIAERHWTWFGSNQFYNQPPYDALL